MSHKVEGRRQGVLRETKQEQAACHQHHTDHVQLSDRLWRLFLSVVKRQARKTLAIGTSQHSRSKSVVQSPQSHRQVYQLFLYLRARSSAIPDL